MLKQHPVVFLDVLALLEFAPALAIMPIFS
jgi:hypothetical protein